VRRVVNWTVAFTALLRQVCIVLAGVSILAGCVGALVCLNIAILGLGCFIMILALLTAGVVITIGSWICSLIANIWNLHIDRNFAFWIWNYS